LNFSVWLKINSQILISENQLLDFTLAKSVTEKKDQFKILTYVRNQETYSDGIQLEKSNNPRANKAGRAWT